MNPKKPNKSKSHGVSMTPTMVEAAKQAAASEGRSLSNYIVRLIEEDLAARGVKQAPALPAKAVATEPVKTKRAKRGATEGKTLRYSEKPSELSALIAETEKGEE